MPEIARTAHFRPTDALPQILEDLACPACGHQDPLGAHGRITDNKLRIFCECGGAFLTISLTFEQASTLAGRVN